MRLIDADAALRSLPDDLPYKASVKRVMIQAETVDAVPVVRCEDCLWYNKITAFCNIHSSEYNGGESWAMFAEDDFCSYGERRDDDAETD